LGVVCSPTNLGLVRVASLSSHRHNPERVTATAIVGAPHSATHPSAPPRSVNTWHGRWHQGYRSLRTSPLPGVSGTDDLVPNAMGGHRLEQPAAPSPPPPPPPPPPFDSLAISPPFSLVISDTLDDELVRQHRARAGVRKAVCIASGTGMSSGQLAAFNGQRATGNGRRAKGNGQRATGNGQRATGNGQRATGNGQRATGDMLMLLMVEVKFTHKA
jgi:hypothetical protein